MGEWQLWTVVRRLEPLIVQEADVNKQTSLPKVSGRKEYLGFGVGAAKVIISFMADVHITALEST